MKDVLLIKYGEIALRGKNRFIYEKKLINAIRKNLKGEEGYQIFKEQGRFVLERVDGEIDFDKIIPKVKTVFGIGSICPCVRTEDQVIENLKELSLNYLKKFYGDKKLTFKVETKRSDKRYPMTSREVSSEVGGYIFENMENISVDVKNPQVLLMVELRNYAYIYSSSIKCYGGLPVGSSGTGALLLSGGIDSPVAGFMMAKRGVALEAVYFHSPPYTSERAEEKVYDLAERLSVFTGNINLHVVPFTDVQLYLLENVPHEKLTIFLKRAMLKIAERIAEQTKCQCLITGDSIGQVASQTLQSIHAVSSSTKLPIIRPLAAMDKQEIINIAKEIETFEISIRPYNDCCTVFVAEHPETRPKTDIIEKMESRLSLLEEKIESAVLQTKVTNI